MPPEVRHFQLFIFPTALISALFASLGDNIESLPRHLLVPEQSLAHLHLQWGWISTMTWELNLVLLKIVSWEGPWFRLTVEELDLFCIRAHGLCRGDFYSSYYRSKHPKKHFSDFQDIPNRPSNFVSSPQFCVRSRDRSAFPFPICFWRRIRNMLGIIWFWGSCFTKTVLSTTSMLLIWLSRVD